MTHTFAPENNHNEMIMEISGSGSYLRKDLIEACKSGDPKAQFQIYKLYCKEMFDLSLGIVNDPNEAEDIVQESFIVAFEKVGALLGMTSFSTWLKKLVRDLSIDSWRKNNVIIG